MKDEFKNYVKERHWVELRDYQLRYAHEILDKVENGDRSDFHLDWDKQTGKTVISWYLADILTREGYRCCFMSSYAEETVMATQSGFMGVVGSDDIDFLSATPRNEKYLQGRSYDIIFLEDPQLIDEKLLDFTIRPMAVNGFLVFIDKNEFQRGG